MLPPPSTETDKLVIEVRSPRWRGREVATRFAWHTKRRRDLPQGAWLPNGDALTTGLDLACEAVQQLDERRCPTGRLEMIRVHIGLGRGLPHPEDVARFYEVEARGRRRLHDRLVLAPRPSEPGSRPSPKIAARTWMVRLLCRDRDCDTAKDALDLVCDAKHGFDIPKTSPDVYQEQLKALLQRVPEAKPLLSGMALSCGEDDALGE